MKVEDLYREARTEALRPVVGHTMKDDVLKKYVEGKFSREQADQIKAACTQNTPIRVRGVYQGHIDQYLAARDLRRFEGFLRPTHAKRFNSERPILVKARDEAREFLYLFVFPSPEYVKQYADLVVQLVTGEGVTHENVTCEHYPLASESLAQWSGLAEGLLGFVQSGDIALIGHVDLMSEYFEADAPEWRRTTEWQEFGEDSMFAACVHERGDARVTMLGVRESFWGSAAGRVARALVDAGAVHVIYTAKMGVLSRPERIHSVMCPEQYYVWKPLSGHDEGTVTRIEMRRSPLSDMAVMSMISSGAHLTVPTVVGETYVQQKSYADKGIVSVDNEISYIATALNGTSADFTALHFVTDYVRNEFSKEYEATHNLTSTRAEVRDPKHQQFRFIASLIKQYAEVHALRRDRPQRDPYTPAIRIVPTSKDLPWREFISRTQSSLWLIGNGLIKELTEYKSAFEEKVAAGVSLRFSVLDPASPYMDLAALEFGDPLSVMKHECETTKVLLERLKGRDRITVQYLPQAIPCGIYFSDAETNNPLMMIVPHVFGVDTPELPAFLLGADQRETIQTYFDQAQCGQRPPRAVFEKLSHIQVEVAGSGPIVYLGAQRAPAIGGMTLRLFSRSPIPIHIESARLEFAGNNRTLVTGERTIRKLLTPRDMNDVQLTETPLSDQVANLLRAIDADSIVITVVGRLFLNVSGENQEVDFRADTRAALLR